MIKVHYIYCSALCWLFVHYGYICTLRTCLYITDILVHYGYICTLRTYLYITDILVHYGYICTLPTYWYITDIFVHYRHNVTLRIYLYITNLFVHYGYIMSLIFSNPDLCYICVTFCFSSSLNPFYSYIFTYNFIVFSHPCLKTSTATIAPLALRKTLFIYIIEVLYKEEMFHRDPKGGPKIGLCKKIYLLPAFHMKLRVKKKKCVNINIFL